MHTDSDATHGKFDPKADRDLRHLERTDVKLGNVAVAAMQRLVGWCRLVSRWLVEWWLLRSLNLPTGVVGDACVRASTAVGCCDVQLTRLSIGYADQMVSFCGRVRCSARVLAVRCIAAVWPVVALISFDKFVGE